MSNLESGRWSFGVHITKVCSKGHFHRICTDWNEWLSRRKQTCEVCVVFFPAAFSSRSRRGGGVFSTPRALLAEKWGEFRDLKIDLSEKKQGFRISCPPYINITKTGFSGTNPSSLNKHLPGRWCWNRWNPPGFKGDIRPLQRLEKACLVITSGLSQVGFKWSELSHLHDIYMLWSSHHLTIDAKESM